MVDDHVNGTNAPPPPHTHTYTHTLIDVHWWQVLLGAAAGEREGNDGWRW